MIFFPLLLLSDQENEQHTTSPTRIKQEPQEVIEDTPSVVEENRKRLTEATLPTHSSGGTMLDSKYDGGFETRHRHYDDSRTVDGMSAISLFCTNQSKKI